AVAAAPKRGADRVQVVGTLCVDADHRVVERPLAEAVDAPPGLAAVVAAEDAAGLEADGALEVLAVRDLAEQHAAAVGAVRPAALAAARLEREVDRRGLLAARIGDLHGLPR